MNANPVLQGVGWQTDQGKQAFPNNRARNLDLLRGIAALLVCASHIRAFLFVDFADLVNPGVFTHVFYIVTGLGHQAVVIFFVLSGYLVGGSVLKAYQSGCWSWQNYAIRRLTRLWVVLLPALLLTLAFDTLGYYSGLPGYDGSLHFVYGSGPTPDVPADFRLTTLLGNVLFLQTISFKCFGTNGPLWSLANEFWYYVLFPLLCSAIFVQKAPSRYKRGLAPSIYDSVGARLIQSAVCGLLLAALIWWLPVGLVSSGLIWLLGVGAYWARQKESVRRICSHPVGLALGFILCVTSLVASKAGIVIGTDWSVGAVFSLWMIGLASKVSPPSLLHRIGNGLSEISYTLYLTHFPLLAFSFFWLFKGRQYTPGTDAYLWFVTFLVFTIMFCAAAWFCFERNTNRIRRQIERLMSKSDVAESKLAA